MREPAWDKMRPKALASLREAALRDQYRYQLYAYSPFYRQKLDQMKLGAEGISSLADLPIAPLVTRSMLAASESQFSLRPTRRLIQKYGASRQLVTVSLEMILRGSQRSEQLVRNEYEPAHQLATSGTQGDPITLSLSKTDLVTLAIQGQRMLEVAGVGSQDKILNLLPNTPSGGFWTTWLGGVSAGATQTAFGDVDPLRAVEVLIGEGASVVIGEAAFLLRMFEIGVSSSKLRTLILAPKVTPPDLRRELEAAAGPGRKVLATYGFAEARAVWAECAEGGAAGGFHTYPDLEIFEVVSSGRESVVNPAQGGELVFTGLRQRGTALARYRPGDIVSKIETGPCPYCGRNVERIFGPIRRTGKLVTVRLADTAPLEIDQKVLTAALAHPDLAAWQLEVTTLAGQANGLDDLCLLFRPREESDPATLAVELDGALREKLGISPQMVLSDRTGGGLVDLRQNI